MEENERSEETMDGNIVGGAVNWKNPPKTKCTYTEQEDHMSVQSIALILYFEIAFTLELPVSL